MLLSFISLLLVIVTALACIENSNLTPEEVVKKYWDYCLKGDFDKAVKLTCESLSCGEKSPVQSETADMNGNKLPPVEFDIDTCCEARMIADGKLKLKNILDAKTSEKLVVVKIEVEWANGKSAPYYACLEKDKNKNWAITRIDYDLGWISYDMGAACDFEFRTRPLPKPDQSN